MSQAPPNLRAIDGLKAIETIEQGDLIWSRHEETLEYGYRPVVNTVSFDDKEIYEVVVEDNDGKLETYQTTEEHPFWVVDTGWLPASLLQTGMTLVNRDDEAILTVVSQNKLNKTDTVYNFEVAEFHTYHIGEFGTWVHNADCDIKFDATNHGYKNFILRGFNEDRVNGIVRNYSEKGYQPGGQTVYLKKQANGYYDVLIVNRNNELVTAVGGNTKSLPNRKAVTQMLNNNGGFSGLPLD